MAHEHQIQFTVECPPKPDSYQWAARVEHDRGSAVFYEGTAVIAILAPGTFTRIYRA